jgi:transposase
MVCGVRKTISVDLRERILYSYDNDEGTRPQIAHRFRVSLGMVKKLLQQRRHTGDIAPLHHRSGRKPLIVAVHQRQLRVMLAKKTDLTLREMRSALALDCSLQALHTVLDKMGLTLKKRRLGPASKTGPTSRGRGARGGGASLGLTRHGSSSSTSRGPKRT